MLDTLFSGVFDTTVSFTSITNFIICMVVALVLGLLLALTYTYKTDIQKLWLLSVTCSSMCCNNMVNGNIGTGGSSRGLSLVRFEVLPELLRK